jgi:hypothetical protein
MFTLLTTVISFLSGGVPKLLDFFQNRSDNKHEVQMAQLQFQQQLELQKAGFTLQKDLEEIKYDEIQLTTAAQERANLYQHDIEISKGASTWVINARAMVRPVITYGLFGLLVFIDLFGCYYAVKTGTDYSVVINTLWDDDTQIIWASVVSFWFGTQAFSKK